MSSAHIGSSRTIHINHALIDELDARLAWHDKPRSYRLLMAVLYAVRERLVVNDTVKAAIHGPVRLCGSYFEELPPPTTCKDKYVARDFIERVALGFKPDPIKEPMTAILTVVDLLAEQVSEREWESEDMRQIPRESLQRAWIGHHASAGPSL